MPYVKNSERYRRKSKRSRARKRLAFTAAVVLLAIVLCVALRPRTRATPMHAATPHHDVAVHIALAHRAAAPRWGAAARADVQQAVRAALAPGTTDAQAWSCIVLAQDGSVLYDDHGSSAVTPASAEKLIVADTALSLLGPEYRFDTLLAAAQQPNDGAINGDLWLVGSGDPSLRSDDLIGGIHSLHLDGLHSVSGSVVVDPSALNGDEINPLWNADDGNEDFMAATSGISIDEDTVEFDVTGTAPGEPAQVRIKPFSRAVRYYGSVTSGGGDDVIIAATETPNQFHLDGNIPAGTEEKFWVPVHGIPNYAADVTEQLLKQAGIDVAHAPQTGTVPVDAQILWEHRSKPLPDLLKHMLVNSDNHFAEQFMRTVGGVNGDAADDRDGLAVERHLLASQAIPTPGLRLVDGSGLAHANRIAAITLARILAHFDSDPRGNMLYPLLPRGGMDGTLKYYRFTSAMGRVRAKSGHVDNVASLAGYVETRKHGRVVFAFLINGSPGDPDGAIVDAVDRLAER
jgi:D-alanyl-D-alanine carboxypeptidase/D-alanyl-D-alanine-endopeptidase (penicillin-binding protein 4)